MHLNRVAADKKKSHVQFDYYLLPGAVSACLELVALPFVPVLAAAVLILVCVRL
jgi:hypothetical protein